MNFYMYGGCEIHDTIPALQKSMPQHNFIQQGATTLGSMYSKHGRIAEATYEWYNQPKFARHTIKPARQIYREIVAKDHLKNIKEDNLVKKDSWIIVSFVLEAEARMQKDGEHITFIKQLVDKPRQDIARRMMFPLEHLQTINDPKNTVMWDDPFIGEQYWSGKGDWLARFADELKDMFDDRVILLFTPPARKWRSKEHGVYHQLPTQGQYSNAYWKKKTGEYWETYSWEKVVKGYKGIYNGFKRWAPFKPRSINVPWQKLIGDDEHYMGKSPYHYDEESVLNISKYIKDEIKEIENEQRKLEV